MRGNGPHQEAVKHRNVTPEKLRSIIAEQRTVETLVHGAPKTDFLKAGDTVRIEMPDGRGRSIFGAIEQTVRTHV